MRLCWRILFLLSLTIGVSYPAILRRIINRDHIRQLSFLGIHKKYVDYCFVIKPQSAIVLIAHIPFCAKIPRQFDGDVSYFMRIDQAETHFSFTLGKKTYYLCEAILPDPESFGVCRGIWLQIDEKCYLLKRTEGISPDEQFEIYLGNEDQIGMHTFHY